MLTGSLYSREAMPHITKGGCYALDYRCDTDNSVGARVSEQLHHGRVYSRPAGDCHYCGAGQNNFGTQTLLTGWIKEANPYRKGEDKNRFFSVC